MQLLFFNPFNNKLHISDFAICVFSLCFLCILWYIHKYIKSNNWVLIPTPVFLPGESQEWGSLLGCRLWDRTESDTTEVT